MKKLLVGSLLCLAIAVVPAAADDHDSKGFFVGVEATSLRASGGVQDYAILDPDDSNSAPEGRIQTLDYDYEISPRVTLGWATGNGGTWALTWWDYDETATDSVSATTPMELRDILFHADDAFDGYEGTATANGALQATLIDFGYSRPLTQSDKFSTRWNVGLRSAKLDSGPGVTYYDTSFMETETVALGSYADGIGLTGGLTGTFQLWDNWKIQGGSSYSLLAGDIMTSTFMDDGSIVANIRSTNDTTFSIIEARCTLVWDAADWIDLWLGWEFSQWNSVVQTNLFPDDVHDAFVQRDTTDMSWSGFTFGAGFKF